MNKKSLLLFGVAIACGAICKQDAKADAIIYENATDPIGIYNAEKIEYGDQIYFAGAERVLTEIRFGYYADYDALQVFQEHDFPLLRTRVYANDGVVLGKFYTAPGTVLYDSGWTQITTPSKGYGTAKFSGLSVNLVDQQNRPLDTVTWTVEFAGFQKENESAGALFQKLASVGVSFNFYWHREADGSWFPIALFDPSDQSKKNNFNLQFKAVDVPEPTALALMAVGGAVMLFEARRRGRI